MCAEILHIGHIEFLKQCKEQCDYLVVGVMSDVYMKKYKPMHQPPRYPLVWEWDRMKIVSSIKYVDFVTLQKKYEFPKYLWIPKKDTIIFDSEEHRGKREGADVYFPRTEGISSTQIKEKIIETHHCKCKAKRGVKRK